MEVNSEKIWVKYRSIDGCYKLHTFRTLRGAQRFATRYVGKTPEISDNFNYAVSSDGIGKITSSIPLRELFQIETKVRVHGMLDEDIGGFGIPGEEY